MTYDSKSFKEYQVRRLAMGKGQIKKTTRAKGNAAYVRAGLMPDSVKEHVAKIRLDIFGSQEPPFSNIETMGEWIRTEASKQNSLNNTDVTDIVTLQYPCNDPVQGLFASRIPVFDNVQLRKLVLAVRFIAKDLDCQEGQATALILADKLPIIPAISVEIPQTFYSDRPNKGKIIITIREPISEARLVQVYRQLKQALWGDKNHQLASERDCKLVEFVEQNIDPNNPQWEENQKRWNREYPNFAFDGMDNEASFRQAYKRAKQKIYPSIHWGDKSLKS